MFRKIFIGVLLVGLVGILVWGGINRTLAKNNDSSQGVQASGNQTTENGEAGGRRGGQFENESEDHEPLGGGGNPQAGGGQGRNAQVDGEASLGYGMGGGDDHEGAQGNGGKGRNAQVDGEASLGYGTGSEDDHEGAQGNGGGQGRNAQVDGEASQGYGMGSEDDHEGAQENGGGKGYGNGSPGEAQGNGQGGRGNGQGGASTGRGGANQEPLTESEIEALNLALDDEYKALATYQGVLDTFGEVAPFAEITLSEQRHIDALVTQFDKYGIPVPENPWFGAVPVFTTLSEACQAGVEAEIANVALYEQLFTMTDHQDLLQVFTNLSQASQESHLPEFQACQ
jgi:hypothetical protein